MQKDFLFIQQQDECKAVCFCFYFLHHIPSIRDNDQAQSIFHNLATADNESCDKGLLQVAIVIVKPCENSMCPLKKHFNVNDEANRNVT